MKTLKNIALAGTIAIALVTITQIDSAYANKVDNPFQQYGTCVLGCVENFAANTWGRTFCAADCYLHLVKDTIAFFTPW
jgi:hypothetical protein